jgi:phosphate-selective porin OprO/OprP
MRQIALFLLGLFTLFPALAFAQGAGAPPPTPATGSQGTEESIEPTPGARLPWASLRFHLVILGDYTWFSQDASSLAQVGQQDDQFEFRASRISLTGGLFHNQPRQWGYLVAFEYHGLDGDADNDFSFFDYALRIPTRTYGNVWVGKMKPTMGYEMVGDSANLPQSERILGVFLPSRSVGVRFNRTFPRDRATLAVGAFNDWYEKDISYKDSAWDVTARATGVPLWANDGRRFLHIAGSWKYQGADKGVVRYKGAPESHVADNFVDTGEIAALHANHIGAELLWNEGPVSVLIDAVTARVTTPLAGIALTPGHFSFGGGYLTASWIVTGETRAYDRSVGYARRVVPSRRWGAIELVGRYSMIDTTDGSIDGGVMGKWFASVSYYTRRWRMSIGSGQTSLDRAGVTGKTWLTLARAQWVY